MTNEELVARVQAGQRDLLPVLWEQTSKFIARKAWQRMRLCDGIGGVTVDDLCQSGYIALEYAASTFDPEDDRSFIGWLSLALKTAFAEAEGRRSVKQAQDPLHRAGSLDAPPEDDADTVIGDLVPDPSAEKALEAVEYADYLTHLHAALEAAMADLPEVQRKAVYGRYWRGEQVNAKDHSAALRALRHPSRSVVLRAFL